jgi:hypothetical protein
MINTNIFFVHGPLVLAVVKRLLETDNHLRDSNNYCFIFFKERLDIKLPYCQTFSYATFGLVQYLKSQIDYKKKITTIESNHGSYNAFLANPFHFATNYALFSKNRRKAFLLEDGLANFYDAQVRNNDKYKMFAKAALGLITGLKYKPYLGHITAFDRINYSSIYVFNDELLFTDPGHVDIVPGFETKGSINHDNKTIVILDQDIESLLPKKDSIRARNKLYTYLRNSSCNRILYKKHPSQKRSHFEILLKKQPNTEYIFSTLPIEMLIEEINPTEIISFLSSALITLSDSHPHIKCTSIGYNLFNRISKNILKELFLSRQVNIVPV